MALDITITMVDNFYLFPPSSSAKQIISTLKGDAEKTPVCQEHLGTYLALICSLFDLDIDLDIRL